MLSKPRVHGRDISVLKFVYSLGAFPNLEHGWFASVVQGAKTEHVLQSQACGPALPAVPRPLPAEPSRRAAESLVQAPPLPCLGPRYLPCVLAEVRV